MVFWTLKFIDRLNTVVYIGVKWFAVFIVFSEVVRV